MGWIGKDNGYYENYRELLKANSLYSQKEKLVKEQQEANNLMKKQNKLLEKQIEENRRSFLYSSDMNPKSYLYDTDRKPTYTYTQTRPSYYNPEISTGSIISMVNQCFDKDLLKYITKENGKKYINNWKIGLIPKIIASIISIFFINNLPVSLNDIYNLGHLEIGLFIFWLVLWLFPILLIITCITTGLLEGIISFRIYKEYNNLPDFPVERKFKNLTPEEKDNLSKIEFTTTDKEGNKQTEIFKIK